MTGFSIICDKFVSLFCLALSAKLCSRYQADNFQAQKGVEALNMGVGVLASPGQGVLVEDCDVADAANVGVLVDAKSKLRFDSFFNDGLNHSGGIDLGFGSN